MALNLSIFWSFRKIKMEPCSNNKVISVWHIDHEFEPSGAALTRTLLALFLGFCVNAECLCTELPFWSFRKVKSMFSWFELTKENYEVTKGQTKAILAFNVRNSKKHCSTTCIKCDRVFIVFFIRFFELVTASICYMKLPWLYNIL